MKINEANTHIITSQFEYHQPGTVEEAIRLLAELPDVRVMAGGTDLIPKMKQRIIEASNIVSLKKIKELAVVKEQEGTIFIGAMARLRDVERSEVIREKMPILYECVKSVGSVQIRNMGTLGGNLCNASPAADGALGLAVLDAAICIEGPSGSREVICADFFRGPGLSVLERGEIVKGFKIPPLPDNTGCCFISIGRTSLDISTISIAVVLTRGDERVNEIRIGLGSVAPTPLRMGRVEEWLKGRRLGPGVIEKGARMISSGIEPITDIRGTAEYRREAAFGLAREAITRAWGEEADKE